jgi:Zn-dependent peptidase ImmA (M78 family)
MKRWLTRDIQHLIKKYGAVSFANLAADFNVLVNYADLGKNIYGYNTTSKRIPIITINENLSKQTQEAVGFHELGHIRYHKGINTQFFDVRIGNLMTRGYELEANEFMLAMLLDEYPFCDLNDKLKVLDYLKLPHELQYLPWEEIRKLTDCA